MEAILRTNDFTEDYRIVEVLKNPISEQNGLALVLIDKEQFMTGGILCEFDWYLKMLLDSLSNEGQWKFLLKIKLPRVLI